MFLSSLLGCSVRPSYIARYRVAIKIKACQILPYVFLLMAPLPRGTGYPRLPGNSETAGLTNELLNPPGLSLGLLLALGFDCPGPARAKGERGFS